LFLILELMHFASEILTPEELNNGAKGAISDKELKMAQTLIESMSTPWEPEKYRDEYRNAVLELIEQKAQNKEIADRPAAPVRATNVVDLVKVLQESLSRNQSIKPKRNGARSNGSRSTSTLVKQKRRAAA
jgi:DNA end-binding protein Ku